MEQGSDGERPPVDEASPISQALSRAERLLEELRRHQVELEGTSPRAVAPELAAEGRRRLERAVAAVERLRAGLLAADEL